MNAIEKTYENNKGYCSTDGVANFIFLILCGVLQGCPLSGTLFVMVMDPIMHLFQIYIEDPGHGRIRACADDVGGAIKRLVELKRMYLISEAVRKATGLSLKPNKGSLFCKLVLPVSIIFPSLGSGSGKKSLNGQPFRSRMLESILVFIWALKVFPSFGLDRSKNTWKGLMLCIDRDYPTG